MFRYYFTQYFKPYQRQIKILYNTFFAYFLLELFVGVFGTLVLMAYFKNDTALEIQFMQNLPMSVKILFIHSCWFYVATCILIIFSLFFIYRLYLYIFSCWIFDIYSIWLRFETLRFWLSCVVDMLE